MIIQTLALLLCIILLFWDNIRLRKKLRRSNYTCQRARDAYFESIKKPFEKVGDPWSTERSAILNEDLRKQCMDEIKVSPNVFDKLTPREADIFTLYLIDRKRLEDIAIIFDMDVSVVRAFYESSVQKVLREFGREKEFSDWLLWRPIDCIPQLADKS